jgi:hypothetical protein
MRLPLEVCQRGAQVNASTLAICELAVHNRRIYSHVQERVFLGRCLAPRQTTRRVTGFYGHVLGAIGFPSTYEVEGGGPIPPNPLADVLVMDRASPSYSVRAIAVPGASYPCLWVKTGGVNRRGTN